MRWLRRWGSTYVLRIDCAFSHVCLQSCNLYRYMHECMHMQAAGCTCCTTADSWGCSSSPSPASGPREWQGVPGWVRLEDGMTGCRRSVAARSATLLLCVLQSCASRRTLANPTPATCHAHPPRACHGHAHIHTHTHTLSCKPVNRRFAASHTLSLRCVFLVLLNTRRTHARRYEVLYYHLGLSRVAEFVQLGLLDAGRTITMKARAGADAMGTGETYACWGSMQGMPQGFVQPRGGSRKEDGRTREGGLTLHGACGG